MEARLMQRILCAWILLFALVLSPLTAVAVSEVLHRERSQYRNIVVVMTEERGRCMIFPVGNEGRLQTCMDPKDPDRLVLAYAPMALAGLLVNPNPKRILILGLGGGTLPTTLTRLLPDASIDVVELDQAVVNVAKGYFNLVENDRLRVKVQDGRVFVKRALLNKRRYDYIILDAFDGDYIPEHLMSKEFLEEARSLLSFSGVLAANTFSTSNLYDHESVTYQKVFRDMVVLRRSDSGNRILLVSPSQLPDSATLLKHAKELEPKVKRFGFNPHDLIGYIEREPDWDQSVRVLTDDYSPANLLRGSR